MSKIIKYMKYFNCAVAEVVIYSSKHINEIEQKARGRREREKQEGHRCVKMKRADRRKCMEVKKEASCERTT